MLRLFSCGLRIGLGLEFLVGNLAHSQLGSPVVPISVSARVCKTMLVFYGSEEL